MKNDESLNPVISELINSLISPVMIINEDGIIIYTNEIMKETFGNLQGLTRSFLFSNTPLCEENNNLPTEGNEEVILADVAYHVKWSAIKEDGNNYQIYILDDISESASAREEMKNNIKMLKQESDIAKHIQTSILPADGEYDGAIKLSSSYVPAGDLGGDVYGLVRVSPDETLFYIADVSGHGIQASLLTMYLRERIRSSGRLAANGLDQLIDELMSDYISLDIDATIYATALFCVYNRPKGELSVANAGHNCMPLIVRAGGRVEEIQVKGMPISKLTAALGEKHEEEILNIQKGDRVILYTDGIIEEYSRAEKGVFGSEGVRRLSAELHELEGKEFAERVITESDRYMTVSASDDRAIIVVDIIA